MPIFQGNDHFYGGGETSYFMCMHKVQGTEHDAWTQIQTSGLYFLKFRSAGQTE